MHINIALEIAEDFRKYLDTGDEKVVKKYTVKKVRMALSAIKNLDRDEPWYKEMEHFIVERQKKWWHDPLLVAVVSAVSGALVGSAITGYFAFRIAGIGQNKIPEIPVTVTDKRTGNQLYIGRPIARKSHYEFPITLNDGQGSYRIDQYQTLNAFKVNLILKETPPMTK